MKLIYSGFYLFFLIFFIFNLKGKGLRVLFFMSGLLTLILCFVALIVSLPFSGADAVGFERLAWNWSSGSFSDVLSTFDPSRSYLISSITAVFYHFLGREIFIPIIINAVLGLFIMYYSIVLFDEVWGKLSCNRKMFFLMVAFSPMLTINSAVVLRENYIILLSLLATIHLARFANNGNVASVIYFVFFVVLSSFFHGGMVLYILGLPVYLIFSKSKMKSSTKVFWVVLLFVLFSFILNYMEFGKVKQLQEGAFSADDIAERLQNVQDSNTRYLSGLIPNNPFDILWQSPIRSFYFLTKPFLWDVKSFGHAIAFLDALVWFFIVFTIYKNRKSIYSNPAAFAILCCCIAAVFAFSYGTSNFGTALRHRTKFYVEMLALASPFFISFKFNRFGR